VVNAGHCNQKVLSAARQQMEKLIHCGSYIYYVPAVADLAEKLAQITPGSLSKCFFGNSGAEANEGALRVSKLFNGKKEFISLQGSFHGRTWGTLSITGNSGRKRGGGPFAPGCTFHPAPYCYRCPYDRSYPSCELYCAKDLRRTIQFNTSGDVCAFIAEPVMGEGGVIVPPLEYFQEIKKVLDEHGILFIADEVQSGFCRTGRFFAIEHFQVTPDIMTMAKGIADGFPLSCFITREEIASCFKPGDHLSTFGGNPVSCAAALANIQFLLEEKITEQAEEKGKMVLEALSQLKADFPLIGNVRGLGLMIGIELVKDEAKTPAPEEASQIKKLMREHGFLIGVGGTWGNVLRWQPPLVISKEELSSGLEALRDSLAQLK